MSLPLHMIQFGSSPLGRNAQLYWKKDQPLHGQCLVLGPTRVKRAEGKLQVNEKRGTSMGSSILHFGFKKWKRRMSVSLVFHNVTCQI